MSNLLKLFFNELEKNKKLAKLADNIPTDKDLRHTAELAQKLLVNLVRTIGGETANAVASSTGVEIATFQKQKNVSTGLVGNIPELKIHHIETLGAFLQFLHKAQIQSGGKQIVMNDYDLNQKGMSKEELNRFMFEPTTLQFTVRTPTESDEDLPKEEGVDENPEIDQSISMLNIKEDLNEYKSETSNNLEKATYIYIITHTLRLNGKIYYVLNSKVRNTCYCWDTNKKFVGNVSYQSNIKDFQTWTSDHGGTNEIVKKPIFAKELEK